MRKLIAFVGLPLLCALGASAAPASGRPVKVVSPDGTETEVVAVGNEHSRHYIYTSSGLTVDWLPSGSRHSGITPIAPKLRAGKQNIFRTEKQMNQGKVTANGREAGSEAKFLVILVDFPDRPFATANPHQAFDEIMNGEDMPVRGSRGSARRYFREQSSGAFSPDFEVVGPVTMSHGAGYYASVGVDDSPTGMVVKEACQQLESQLDFTDYDIDGDGICDNIYLFYAGKGQADGGGTSTIWPHSARLDIDWGIEADVDGVRISNYACSAELNGSGTFSGIGTFCHEFCHVLGLPDLYYNGVAHPRSYSLMASGNYNGNGFCPPNLSSYERYSLGWLLPEEILQSDWITLSPLAVESDARIVPTPREEEYFILENRRKEGWDSYLPGHGLLVWHIDFDQEAWDNNIPNADRYHQRVFLVRADNNLYGYPDAATPFPGTTGNDSFGPSTTPAFASWDGTPADCALTTISETPAGNVTFHAATSRASLTDIFVDGSDFGSDDGSDFGGENRTAGHTSVPDGIYTLDGRFLPESTPLLPGIYIRVKDSVPTKIIR